MSTSSAYVGDGATTAFNITFDYVDTASVRVSVDEVDVAFTWNTATQVIVSPAPAVGTVVLIYRSTDITDPAVVFQNAGVLTSDLLNDAVEQVLLKQQEIEDAQSRGVNRNLRVSNGDTLAPIPTDRAGQFLAFDEDGNPLMSPGSETLFTQDDPASSARTVRDKLRDFVSPMDFGAAGDGITNDLAAVQAALNYACAHGKGVDGGALVYAVSGNLTVSAQTRPWVRALRLKQLSQVNGRVTLHFENCERVRIDRLEINMGSNAATGDCNSTFGLWIENGSHHQVRNVEAFGNGKNSFIAIWGTSKSDYDGLKVRDAVYDDATATDDLLQGIWMYGNTDCSLRNPSVSNLTGNADASYPARFTRGICFGGNVRCSIVDPKVRDVDQGIDISGSDGNLKCTVLGGHSYQCTTVAVKLANSAIDCKVIGHIAERIGQYAFGAGGPAEAGLANKTRDCEFINCTALDVGYNAFPQPHRAFDVHKGDYDLTYPQGIKIIGCKVRATMSVSFVDVRPAGETSGTLSAPWTGVTGSYTCKFGSGEIKTVSLTNGSTGAFWTGGLASGAVTTTLLLQPMTVAFYNDADYDTGTRKLNEVVNCSSEGHTSSIQTGFQRHICRLTGDTPTSLANGVSTSVGWNIEVEDTTGLHSTTSNTDEVRVWVMGRYRIKAKLVFAAGTTTGYRRVHYTKNDVVQTTSACAPVSGEATTCLLDEEIDLVPGEILKLYGEQTSGGALNVDRLNSYFHVELIRAS
jgi:hypothetical protein